MTTQITRRDVLTIAVPAAGLVVAGASALAARNASPARSDDIVVTLYREWIEASQATDNAATRLSAIEKRHGDALGMPWVAVPFMPAHPDGQPWVASTPAAIDDVVNVLPTSERPAWRARLRAGLEAENRRLDGLRQDIGYDAALVEVDAATDRLADIKRRICRTPTGRNAGIAAKLRIALDSAAGPSADLIRSALEDLESFGGAA